MLLAACAGCVSGNIRDDFVTGWQNQRDMYIHQYVHQSFVQEQRWIVKRAALVRSQTLEWPAYARPASAAAIRSRALSQDRGRALLLERFLDHMRTTPSPQATVEWFAIEAADIREASRDAVERSQALLAELGGSAAMSEALLERVETTAAAQGVVRGRALQHADLRRTARLYFRARDDAVDISDNGEDLSADAGVGGVRGDALISDVNRMLDTVDLRAAILQPRQCDGSGGIVICTPDRSAAAGPVSEADGFQPAGGLTGPADNAIGIPNTSGRDFFDGRSGW